MRASDSIEREACTGEARTVGSVLMVTPLWGRDGGVAAHVKESAGALARQGLDVHVLAGRAHASEQVEGVKVHHRPELLDTRAAVQARLGEAAELAPDVIHLHQLDDLSLVDALQARAPMVISAHGYPGCTSGVYYFSPGQECTRAHGPGCIPNLLLKGCAHTSYPRTLPAKYRDVTRGMAMFKRANMVVSYSTAVDRHLANNGLARRAIVPYFPTTTPRQGSGHATRRRIVFAGRLVASKGVDALIEAAAEVDADLVICGDGRREQKLRELAQRLGIASRVDFKGWMDAEQLAGEFAEASLVAVPSLWPEPFGIVGIEAFAAGRPAVGSTTGGIVDWLKDGVCGITVAPGDVRALTGALDRMLADPERQHAMGMAGKELVEEHFSPERHVQRLLDTYRQAETHWRAARG